MARGSWADRLLDRVTPQAIFAVIALAAGLVLCFLTPPYQTADENAHFYRSYQVSEGGWKGEVVSVWTGGRLPAGVTRLLDREEASRLIGKSQEKTSRELILRGLDEPWGERIDVTFPNSAIYPPTNYFPQAAGIAAARALGGGPLVSMYAGRVTNLLAYVAVTWAAIRLMPFAPMLLAAVALLPISLFQAATLTADTPLNALSFLFLALSLRAAAGQDGRIDRKPLAARIVIGAMLAAGKSVYAPLLAIGLVRALANRSERTRAVLLAEAAVILVGLAATVAWYATNTEHMISVRSSIDEIDSKAQLAFVLGAPLTYLTIFFDTIAQQTHIYFLTTVGVLGWLDTLLPPWVYDSAPWILALALVTRGRSDGAPPWILRFGLPVLAFGVVFAIFLSLYLSWTPPYRTVVEGVSGRYFIPLLTPVLLAAVLPAIPGRPLNALLRLACAAGFTAMAYGTVVAVIGRYYGA
ncbi:DUF2142 domain-containing protein [Azospirillum himalayense]|uniref:DUF2142 domain-containing protein n=1 Tax=Azospirillum himalayense TaxID=654847 RepID=A0ABW0G2F2_9PROT